MIEVPLYAPPPCLEGCMSDCRVARTLYVAGYVWGAPDDGSQEVTSLTGYEPKGGGGARERERERERERGTERARERER